jgi:hypothetical protein
MEGTVPYIDLLTGDRVSVALESGDDGVSLRVVVRLALTAAAVDASARALGFKSAAESESLRPVREAARTTERSERTELVKARLQSERRVNLMSELEGVSNLDGTLSLSSTFMKRTGKRGSQRARRRTGYDTVVAHGFLRVTQIDDV